MTRDRRLLAAVSLDAGGGGVGAVSRLLWGAIHERWPEDARLLTLVDGSTPLTTAHKLRFGARAAILQAFGGARWVFFSHLGLARVQAKLPAHLHRPYGLFLHGIEVWKPLSEADLRVLRRASLRIANSPFTAARIQERHPGVGPVTSCVLSLPPEVEAAACAVTPRPGAGREPLVLMVGRMDPGEAYKGHAEVIAAWPDVLAVCPDATLVIAGEGADRARLETLARETGAAAAITFAGYVEARTLAGLYDRASVLVMPSRGEGFGLVYLEAMARGVPCIGSRHDAAGDVIVDGVTGFLVDQHDRPAIVQRVVRLLRDAPLRGAMGEAGYRRFRESFTYARFASQVIDLIERDLEPGRRVPARRTVTPGKRLGVSS